MTRTYSSKAHPASFRDPSGFLFQIDGHLYRQVNQSYAEDYDALFDSGLYATLTEKDLLLRHEEKEIPAALPELSYKVIEPQPLDFISYPYEWCFSQLKDAALLTLAIQREAIEHDMSLKDASAFNVQFHGGRPILIDTLSFERLKEGEPWVAYRQFCQHFLAPLALMAYIDIELGKLMRVHVDGIPLPLASRMLPSRSKLRFPLLVHIHWHASAQRRYAGTETRARARTKRMNRNALLGLIDSLQGAVRNLDWIPDNTAWAAYEQTHAYSDEAWRQKRALVTEFLDQTQPRQVWDLGANVGSFSRIASERGVPTVAFDLDPGAVELNYRKSREEAAEDLLPLVMDLTNPSPALGWAHHERMSLEQRAPVDAVLALALVHHLAISNNLPLDRLAAFLAGLCRQLLIEFIPKEDPQVQRLLASREDIFSEYHQAGFESAFAPQFTILKSDAVGDSGRTMYRMESQA